MQIALVLTSVLIISSCSTQTRQLFFDIQPPTPEELAEKKQTEEAALAALQARNKQKNQLTGTAGMSFGRSDDNRSRPEIESVMDWKKAQEMLPKDYKKGIDWSAALEQGLIRPRIGDDPRAEWASAFQWDFIIKAKKLKNHAYFPHSAHTEWLGCKNCHNTSLYPYKRNPATMKEMKKGASCGACHGKKKVAFSLKACKRCHLNRKKKKK